MINILLGAPGSGKSYEAVVYHVLAALQRGRKVITNLPLIVERFAAIDPIYLPLIEVRDTVGRGLREDGSPARVFAAVEDYADDWRHPEGFGPLFVIDECHFCLPKIGTSRAVDEWYSMHRHFNVDVLLITQSAAKISVAIRDLVQVCYKVRKAHAFGKPDHYIRRVFDGIRGSVISEGERKYKPEFFGLYKSHTQGVAAEEFRPDDVKPFLVRFKRWSWMVIFVGVAIVVATIFNKTAAKTKTVTTQTVTLDTTQNTPTAAVATSPLPSASSPTKTTVEIPAPYETKGFHLTGRITMGEKTLYTFAVSQNGFVVASVTHLDLERTGYKWVPMTDCAGTLFWEKKAIPITCDAPQITMAAAGPLPDAGKAVSPSSN